ncbi:MAG: hypothetical protein LW875_08600 [Proteobacteria bacterium]|jgi:hypothetical protein|nr:hypothetical protein [Pseudomonadota bacterium]
MGSAFPGFLLTVSLLLGALPSAGAKPSLTQNWQLSDLEKHMLESQSFVRGEIEDPALLNRLMELFRQSSQQRSRDWAAGNYSSFLKSSQAWFLFAADFPYEEASLVSLKTASVIRSLLFDELEKIDWSQPLIKITPEQLQWLFSLRISWPVDRMIVSESKKHLPPALLGTVESLSRSLQKNPYQSVEEWEQKSKKTLPESANLLKKLWKKDDYQALKEELNRAGRLQLRVAAAIYTQRTGLKAKTVEELLQGKALPRIPTDYTTGRPMILIAPAPSSP